MNIAYHCEAKNLQFSNRPKDRKENNNLPDILAIIRNEKNILSGTFSHSGSHIIVVYDCISMTPPHN